MPAKIADASGPSARPHAGPCFQRAVPGELEVGGRKLVGSAQARIRGRRGDVILQHGSILIGDDQGLLSELGGAAAHDAPATLDEVLGRPLAEGELEGALVEAFACVSEQASAFPREQELEERYRSDAWTWRR